LNTLKSLSKKELPGNQSLGPSWFFFPPFIRDKNTHCKKYIPQPKLSFVIDKIFEAACSLWESLQASLLHWGGPKCLRKEEEEEEEECRFHIGDKC
jgi:hypothetical protein